MFVPLSQPPPGHRGRLHSGQRNSTWVTHQSWTHCILSLQLEGLSVAPAQGTPDPIHKDNKAQGGRATQPHHIRAEASEPCPL